MGRIRVVIADDSRLARDLLRAIFEAEPGMEVVGEASNGREAVALVQQLRPHLVTMDLEMPLMDGVAAVEEIMCTRAVPILVVSSVADAPRALDAVAHGALEIVPKPDTTPEAAAHLLARARLLAGVSVITRLRARPSAAPSPLAEAAPGVLTAAPTPAPVLTHAQVPACVGGRCCQARVFLLWRLPRGGHRLWRRYCPRCRQTLPARCWWHSTSPMALPKAWRSGWLRCVRCPCGWRAMARRCARAISTSPRPSTTWQ